ncbi:hypothetical protein F2Q69_00025850 [Brassica cretica]|uniref:No apical meristem-associated C-terminal domain-containing protein n=1 Tax=Brassica cretica TaxID=69181 RepID=A0A8S9SD78_BRACR|nr:hypothetical protein F2Q69_00025850 [Brassica cretica]
MLVNGYKFTLDHCWRELRHDQKWSSTYVAKDGGKEKRRQVLEVDREEEDLGEPEARPIGVKAAKAGSKKKKSGREEELSKLHGVLELKEKLSRHKVLDRLLAKKEPLSEMETSLKLKLMSEMLMSRCHGRRGVVKVFWSLAKRLVIFFYQEVDPLDSLYNHPITLFYFCLCSILGWRRIIELDHLATLTREKCSALVRSCYVPSRTTCSSDDIITKQNTKVEDGLGFRGGGRWQNNQPSKRHGGGRSCTAVSSEPCNLKSNLKVKTEVDKGLEQRKVSWPDAHGKDIAHVQEFELSASEDGEHAGKSKRKYCGVCIIQ